MRITKRTVDGLKPTGREHVAWDDDLPGFGVRVRETGSKSYIVQYRAGSGRGAPTRKVTLGAVGKITPDEARTIAKRTLGAVAAGEDPAATKAEERGTLTVAELVDLYLTEHVEAKRSAGTADSYEDALRRLVIPAIGTTKADKVRRADVARVHLKWARTPYQANRMLRVLGAMYVFAGKRGLVPEGFNPARCVEKYPEEGRERFLSSEELERLGAAIREAETVGVPWIVDERKPGAKHVPKANRCTVIGPHAAGAMRLLIFTGARLREVLHLRWSEVDFERGLLNLPTSKTGKKSIVLNAPALAVLAGLPRAGDFVIAGEKADKPRSDLKKPWAVVTRRAGLHPLRIHDMRHSFASVGAGGGLGLPIIGKLLGHTQASTTARYAHLDADPLRRASDAIASTIAAAMGEGTPAARVVELRRARAK